MPIETGSFTGTVIGNETIGYDINAFDIFAFSPTATIEAIGTPSRPAIGLDIDAGQVTFAGTMLTNNDGVRLEGASGFRTFQLTDGGSINVLRNGVVAENFSNKVSIDGSLRSGNSGVLVLGDRNDVFVSGSIVTNNGGGVALAGDSNRVTVSGSIDGSSYGIALFEADGVGSSDNTLIVSGTVFAWQGSGISGSRSGTGNELVVSGTVVGGRGNGIWLTGGGNDVEVTGTVEGSRNGVDISPFGAPSVGSDRLNVSGTVDAGRTGIRTDGDRIDISGTVRAQDTGIDVFDTGLFLTIAPTGLLMGGANGDDTVTDDASAAILIRARGGEQHTISNAGTIFAEPNPDAGGQRAAIIDANASFFTGAFDFSVSAATTVRNTGLIDGDVLLGAGNDVYDARFGEGRVTGALDLGAGNDVGYGGEADETIDGGSGADTLSGGSGNDTLLGGTGNDRFFADIDGTVDTYDGGVGTDIVLYTRTANGVRLNAQLGYALGAEIGLDRLVGLENARGGSGDDRLVGAVATTFLDGQAGDDVLEGSAGNNVLLGGAGDDVIRGYSGFDTITGDAGDDVLSGNFNADTFVFANGFGRDRITDFDALNALEKIDLSGVSSIGSYNDLRINHLVQQGADIVIFDGASLAASANTIVLENVALADLDVSDFVL